MHSDLSASSCGKFPNYNSIVLKHLHYALWFYIHYCPVLQVSVMAESADVSHDQVQLCICIHNAFCSTVAHTQHRL